MRPMTLDDLSDAALRGKRALVRVDFNVPLDSGQVADDTRIEATLPTLRRLLERGAGMVLMSHLGRPKGQWKQDLSLRPVAARLGELIDAPVRFVADIVGSDAQDAAASVQPGSILVLENTRFLPGEEADDRELAEQMAQLGDLYVNDAFGSAHRAHASTAGVADVMKEQGKPAVAGLLMEKEIRYLGQALESPDHPFVAILGGAKISGKIDVIENLLPRVEALLIGGAMANTFFRALGLETADSLVEEDRLDMAGDLLDRGGDKLVLPVDCVVAANAAEDAETRIVARDDVPDGMKILDIGPDTIDAFREHVRGAGTVVWNGPMGMFEKAPFRAGTEKLAHAVADATDAGTTTIIGGGDTAAAVQRAGLAQRMSHVSTGGGASLEFLEGKDLPGVAALSTTEDENG
ncbi:MAG: phosphoglycerate kinase [Gemmatimonadota bacterium]|jgi:phosphoglycerate kinase